MRLLAYVLGLVLATTSALAQVRQSGNVTPRHPACWTTTGTIQDCGTAALPFASSFGVWGSGPTFCVYDSNPATAAGYQRLCFGTTSSGGSIALDSVGTAPSGALSITTNGTPITLASLTPNATPIIGGTSGGILLNFAGVLGNTDGTTGSANLVTSGTFNITPPVPSTTRALNISQTLPSTGSIPGTMYSNLIQGSLNTTVTGPGLPGSTDCACWTLTQISASLGANYNATGGSQVGQAHALAIGMVASAANTTTSDVVGYSGGTGTSFLWPNSHWYGGVSSVSVSLGGGVKHAIGHEFGVRLANTVAGDVPRRSGININNYGTQRAGTLDMAISFVGGDVGGEWGNALVFDKPPGVAVDPLATTANVIYFPPAITQTINSFFEAPNITITSYLVNTKNTVITGAGIATFGSTTSPGAIVLAGGNADTVSTVLTYGGVSKWQYGATATSFFLGPVGGTTSMNADFTTGRVTLPAGVTVTGSVLATGAIAALTGTSVPAGGTAGSGFLFSSTSNFGIFFGSSAPTLSAAKGSLYLRTDGSTTNDRAYINTNGTTGWTALTTGS